MARVLIVEDEGLIAMEIVDIVAAAGHEVVGVAATERKAIGLTRQNRPDLALIDIRIRADGRSDGSQAGIRLAEELWVCHRVPCVFVTAFPDLVTTECAGNTAAFAVVGKPFAPDTLAANIRLALETAALRTPLPT